MKVYQLEVTNICNLKCDFCSMRHSWTKRPFGYLDPKLIDLIDWSETDYVELQLLGEPTLHPNLTLIIDRLTEKDVEIGFSTNNSNPEVVKRVAPKCKMITINDYDKKGIDRELLSMPNVRIQDVGGDFPVEDYTHTKKYSIQKICKIPYEYVSIQWDGDVVPCPRAHGKGVVYGNLYKQTWNEIMEGDVLKIFKGMILENKDVGLCEYCWAPNCHGCRFMFFKDVFGIESPELQSFEYKYWKEQLDEQLKNQKSCD